jgi:eukaryotic-like serine/threonine-protein kinase
MPCRDEVVDGQLCALSATCSPAFASSVLWDPSSGTTRSAPGTVTIAGANLEDFKIGDVIRDKYEVTRILGKGGMGIVLEARHRELGVHVAIKFPRPGLREEPEAVARFKQEARAGMSIKNVHVAQVYDVDTVDGSPFIVMEHLTGRDLAAILEERGPLAIEETADLLVQACEGVSEAHALGIVHRDLKPSNLFVTEKRDGTPLVKVLDFGISKWTESADPSATASSATMGTPLYMSPEQLLSTKSVDRRSDVWSLGVILYEMLTDGPPFHGATSGALQVAILQGTYRKPSEDRPDIPPGLEQLLLETLVKDPASRLPSVEAFAARLAPFGTAVARRSYDEIRQPAPRPLVSSDAAAKALPASAERVNRRSGGLIPATDASMVGGSAMDGRVSGTPGKVKPRRVPWRPIAALGVAAAVGLAVTASRLRHQPAPASAGSPVVASVNSAPTEGTSVPAPAANGEEAPGTSNPTIAIASATTAEAPPTGDTRPSSRADKASTTGAGAPGTVAAQPAAGNVAACASGATRECEAACAANRPGSCVKLAESLEKGVGAPKNLGRAMTLYTQGCDQGSAASCTDLGTMHYQGEGVEKNAELGVKFLSRGCEAGDAKGCLAVSTAYRDGVGLGKNSDRAFTFADRACTMGSPEGCVRVALAMITGAGVTKDVKGGLAKLDAMCASRGVFACETLAQLYTSGAGSDVQADPLLRQQYAKKACAAGSKTSCDVDKLVGRVDSAVNTAARGNALFQSKCDGGEALACGLLGENLLAGIGIGVDRERGIALLKKACDGGVDRACKKLAEVTP